MGDATVRKDSVVAIYDTHAQAEAAIRELERSRFDIKNLSIVGREAHSEERVIGYYNAGDRMKYWGSPGALWGGLWGLLAGSAFFWVPGIGGLLMAGPLVASVVGTLEGAISVGGLSTLGAALHSLGIPKDTAADYETAVKTNKFLVIAHGTAEELANAKSVMHTGETVTNR